MAVRVALWERGKSKEQMKSALEKATRAYNFHEEALHQIDGTNGPAN